MAHHTNKPSPNLMNSTKPCFMALIHQMESYNEFINYHMACNPDHLTKYMMCNVKGHEPLIYMPLALNLHAYHMLALVHRACYGIMVILL
jgi:hypothetical protein